MGTLFVAHGQVFHEQPLLWVLGCGALNVQINFFAHHHFGQGLLRGVLGGYIAHILALTQNHHPVGNFQYLMKFMGDDDNGLAVLPHTPQHIKQPPGLLRGQYSGGLIQNQNIGAAIQHLYNLDRLLLRNRHLVYFLFQIHGKAVTLGDLPHFFLSLSQVEFFFIVHTQHDIFRGRKHIHKIKMLVDHTNIVLKCVFGRADHHFFPVDKDLPGIRKINTGQHIH